MLDTSLTERVKLGTAGWSFPDWEGIVYPRGITGDRLAYMAEYVDIIEINTSFYRPPSPRQSEGWIRKVKKLDGFLFSAKLWQKFTHERGPVSQLDIRSFEDGIKPLADAGMLACLVIQFPWSFRHTEQNILHIERLHHHFQKYPLAIEARHATWDNPEFIEFLRERNICFINIDQPPIRDTLRPTAHVTSSFAYVRLHGRNEKDWFRDDAGRDDRYNYLYNKSELGEWVGHIGNMAKSTKAVYVIANNHYKGQALANSIEMTHMITGNPVKVPDPMFDHYPGLIGISNKPPRQMNLFG